MKLVHTVIWAFFVACILAIPLFTMLSRFRLTARFVAIVAVEVAVLLLNGMTCPLTDVAARYTDDRRANELRHLPARVARPWMRKRVRCCTAGATEQERRSFDGTCRKLVEFLGHEADGA